MTFVDISRLEKSSGELAREFRAARPFPHLVLDSLVSIGLDALERFPAADWDRWTSLGDEYQKNKRACADIEAIPHPFRGLISELSEPRFLRVLEEITGIRRLLPDPYLTGGGLHLSGPAGILSEHIDFHYYRALDLYRRVNVLVYFNDGWTASDGGCLSLFDEQHRPVKTVIPEFGRIVVFATDDRSLHGFPQPVAEGKWRRSVALYYYTAAEAPTFSGDETTHFHGQVRSGAVMRARHVVYRGLLNTSRAISIAAHLVNPAQGSGLFKTVLANRQRESKRRHERTSPPTDRRA